MLRYPLNNPWLVLQQFQVALTRGGSEVGEEEPGILAKALKRQFKKEVLELREIPEQHFKTPLVKDKKGGGFDARNAYRARLIRSEAFYRGDKVIFKEKLECDFFGMTGKRSAQTSLFNEEDLSRDLTFLEQGDLCADVDLGKQPPILVPFLLQSRYIVDELIDHLLECDFSKDIHHLRAK